MRGDKRDKKTGDSPRVFSERMPFTGAFDLVVIHILSDDVVAAPIV
jgi:hypothetical protein